MQQFLKNNWIYLLIYLAILAFVGNILLSYDKVTIHEAINSHVGNYWIDRFFKYFTHAGDGLFTIIVVFVLLFVDSRKAIYIFLSYVGAALVTTILKNFVYTTANRPHFVYNYFVRKDLNLIEGIDMLGLNSFPSGHSTSAFALFFCLIFISKNQLVKLLCLTLSILAAFSRTYISQHWLVDIYVGSVIGASFSVLFYFVFYNKPYSLKYGKPLPELLAKRKTNV